MRLRPLVATIWCLVAAVPASGQQTFPYKAHVVAEDVYVRSGPGKNYYPTAKLKAGDVVEIYRHDPGGWYAIRPPEGSFEWISARYLDPRQDDLAEVTTDGVAARVGSQFSDIRDVIQVRLHQGELVEVLESAESREGPNADPWSKIAPPAGAFRWIHGKYVDLESPRQGVRKTPPGPSPLTDPQVSERASAIAEPPPGEPTPPEPRDKPPIRGAGHWSPVSDKHFVDDRPAPRVDPEHDPAVHTNKFAERASDPAGKVTMRRISPDEFQSQLDDINQDLSSMLIEEPTVWSVDKLKLRAQSLLTQAETAVERGRARLLVKRIEQAQDLKERYIAVNDMESDIARHNRQLARWDEQRNEQNTAVAEEDFDGAGRLRRVVSSTVGAPQYALVDEAGNVRCFVSPAPGVNMQYYLGREIGVTGIRGFIPDRGAQHVTAKHVTPLDEPTILR